MDELAKALLAKHETLAKGQLESFFRGGLEGVIQEAPTPERSAGSTGRTFASTKFSTGEPNISDPGVRGAYPVPDEQDVEYALKKWKPYEDGYIAVGTNYYPFIDSKYPMIPVATKQAREQLDKDQNENVRKANAAV